MICSPVTSPSMVSEKQPFCFSFCFEAISGPLVRCDIGLITSLSTMDLANNGSSVAPSGDGHPGSGLSSSVSDLWREIRPFADGKKKKKDLEIFFCRAILPSICASFTILILFYFSQSRRERFVRTRLNLDALGQLESRRVRRKEARLRTRVWYKGREKNHCGAVSPTAEQRRGLLLAADEDLCPANCLPSSPFRPRSKNKRKRQGENKVMKWSVVASLSAYV